MGACLSAVLFFGKDLETLVNKSVTDKRSEKQQLWLDPLLSKNGYSCAVLQAIGSQVAVPECKPVYQKRSRIQTYGSGQSVHALSLSLAASVSVTMGHSP